MGDEDRSRHLPQRVRGAARDGSAPSGVPVLSEEMRQRIQAAVRAERAGMTAEAERPSTQARPGPATESAATVMSPVGGKIEKANGHKNRRVKPGHAGKPEPNAKAEPVVEPERIVKNGPAVKDGPAVRNGRAPAHHKPVAAVPVEPAGSAGSAGSAVPAGSAGSPGSVPPPEESARTEPGGRPLGWGRVVAFFLVLIAVGGLVAAVSLHSAPPSSGPSAAALQRQEALTRSQAASWVTQQVDPAEVVSCDPVMCAALRADRFPAAKLLVLGPTSDPPVTSAVVVVTAAVRSIFGTSLATAWAPDVLATIGSGTAEITIRLMAPNGALAYQSALSTGVQYRKQFGTGLLNSQKIGLSQVAANQLDAGQVDPRLVLAIASLAYAEPVDVARFENIGPGVSTGLPLRFADLTVTGNPANMSGSAYVSALHAYLSSQRAQLGPVSGQTALSGGQDVFRVEFAAPSPVGSISTPVSP
jgi:hypothetical protein